MVFMDDYCRKDSINHYEKRNQHSPTLIVTKNNGGKLLNVFEKRVRQNNIGSWRRKYDPSIKKLLEDQSSRFHYIATFKLATFKYITVYIQFTIS